MSYIEREKVVEVIKNFAKGAIEDGQATLDPVDVNFLLVKAVEFIPTADVEEVKHGEWKQSPHCKRIYYCSECGRHIENGTQNPQEFFPYCHCGAKMDLKGVTHDVAR